MASPSRQEESVEPSKEGRFPFFSESAERHDPELSAELPILPMRDVALFPGVIGPLAVGRKASIQVVEHALGEKKLVGLVAQRNPAEEHPQPADLYSIGTVVQLLQTQRHPDGSLRVLAQGISRIRVTAYVQEEPFFRAAIQPLQEVVEETQEVETLRAYLVQQFGRLVHYSPLLPGELLEAITNLPSPGLVTDLIAGHLNITLDERQELLELLDVKERMAKLSFILTRELEVIEMGQKIQSEVKAEMAKGQKEFILRQQMKAIQRELGEEGEEAVYREFEERIATAQLPTEVEKVAKHELDRLRTIPPASPEHTRGRGSHSVSEGI